MRSRWALTLFIVLVPTVPILTGVYVNYTLLSEAEASLATQQDPRSSIVAARYAGLTLPLTALVVMAATGIVALRRIRRATYSIVDAAAAIAHGELHRRADIPGLPEGTLRDLGEKFNSMAEIMEQRQKSLAILGEMSGMMQACDSVDEAAFLLEGYGPRLLPGVQGQIFTLAASRNQLRSVAGWGEGTRHEGVLLPNECWALRRGSTHICDDSHTVACAHTTKTPSICIPLSAHGETIGLLVVTGDTRSMPNRVQLLAEQLALTLANLRLRRSLEEQSLRDALTGLYNRRYLEESFPRELARADRENAPLSILMIDADHFKMFNDSQGHEAGDEVLRVIGASMRDLFRETDIVCRYGGEEFCVLMPNCTGENAVMRAEDLRKKIAETSIKLRGERLPAVTLSIGVSSREGDEDAATLIKRADASLYVAKKAGRNRVIHSVARPQGKTPAAANASNAA